MIAAQAARHAITAVASKARETGAAAFLSNSAWSLLNQLVRVGSLGVVLIALSRHFDPQSFGSFACALAFVRVFAVVAGFGLERVVVRRLIDSPGESRAILREAFWLKLGIAAASYVVMIAMLCAIDYQDRLTLSIAAVAGAGLLFQCFDVCEFAFQARHQLRSVFLSRGVAVLACTGLKVGAIFLGAPLLAIAALETLEAAMIGLALVVVYRGHSKSVPNESRILKAAPFRLLAEGFPLLLSTLAVIIYMRTDVVLLGKMSGYASAGLYAAAAQITEACALAPMALLPVLFPMLVRFRGIDRRVYHAKCQRMFSLAVVAAVIVSVMLAIAAPALVTLLYGAAYASASSILVIHAWSIVFIFLSIIQLGYDITEGLTWFATMRCAAGAVINIILNLLLIPRYGPTGAAVATLCSQACSTFLLNVLHRGTRPIFVMQLKALLLLPLILELAGVLRSNTKPVSTANPELGFSPS